MKLYIWIKDRWMRWDGSASYGEVLRDRDLFRNAGYCTALVKA